MTFPQKQFLISPGLMDVEADVEDAYPNTPSSWVSIGILTRWEVEVEWVLKSRWD